MEGTSMTDDSVFVRLKDFPGYSVNRKGEMRTPRGKLLPVHTNRSQHTPSAALKNKKGRFTNVRVPALLLKTFKNIDVGHRPLFPQDGDKTNLHVDNWSTSRAAILPEQFAAAKGDGAFVPAEGFPGYFVNRKGEVVGLWKRKIISRRLKPSGAPSVTIKNHLGQFEHVRVPALLLRTFKKRRLRVDQFTVPKDGNHLNLHINNWKVVSPADMFPGAPFQITRRDYEALVKMCEHGGHGIRTKAAKHFGLSKQHVSNLLNGKAAIPAE
jgi:hypothetical protein